MSQKDRIITSISIIWGFIVLYFFYQRIPYDLLVLPKLIFSKTILFISPFDRILSFAHSIFLALSLWLLAFRLGSPVLEKLQAQWGHSLERFVFSSAIGYGVLSYAALALASTHLLNPNWLKPILYISFIGAYSSFLKKSNREELKDIFKTTLSIVNHNRWTIFFSIITCLLFVIGIFMSFLPETFYDALVYHLAVPKRYLLEQKMVFINNTHSHFPLFMQMIYLWGLVLKNEAVTKLTHVILSILLALAFLSIGKRMKKEFAGVISMILFITIPVFQMNMWNSGIDAGLCFFSFLAIYSFLMIQKENISKPLLLAGVFAGFSVSTKYTGGLIGIIIPISLFLSVNKEEFSWSDIKKPLLGYFAAILLLFLPYLIKNSFFTGNPIYPFFNESLGWLPIDPDRFAILTTGNSGFTPTSIKEFIMAPWIISMNIRSRLSFLGPVFLSLVGFVFLFFLQKKSSIDKKVALLMVLYFLIALTSTRLTRFLLPGFTLCALFFGLILNSPLEQKNTFVKYSLLLLISMGLIHQLSWVSLAITTEYNPSLYMQGQQTKDQYLMQNQTLMNPNSSLPMYRYIEKNINPPDRVLLIAEEKTYNINFLHDASGVYDVNPLIDFCNSMESADLVAQELRRRNWNYIFINVGEIHRLEAYKILDLTEDGKQRFNQFWNRHLEFVHVEYVKTKDGYKNTLLLFKVSGEPLTYEKNRVENFITTN